MRKAVRELYKIKAFHEEDIPCKEIDNAIKALKEHDTKVWFEKSYKDSPFDRAVQRYAQISSRHLSNQIHARLLHELRNVIYSHIWTKDYLDKSADRMRYAWAGIQIPRLGPLPHVIEPTHADPIFAREAMEAYYHCAAGVVEVFVTDYLNSLPRTLHNDAFELGVDPAAHLRKLRLEVLLDFRDMDEVLGLLNNLSDIVHKKDFELHLVAKQFRIRLKLLDQAFAIFVPFCRAFRAEGVRVHLEWQAGVSLGSTIKAERQLDDIIDTWHPGMEMKHRLAFYLDMLDDIDREYRYEQDDNYDPSDFEVPDDLPDSCSDGEES
ncbi:hypothetical protein A1F97_06838 [Pyrenophora tritici-repentis]|nr:hypothetical protein A1F95_01499 [Pyrenophora tritici-repentis]PZD27252.1 hypothetical protein A1F96_06901 [Pyrenophora tritici-repentis]PZD38305.1 hypothetical protein A1F97_06838 [Pyrenophora tritici-repentis]